jgi:hypothetical protein
MTPAQAMQMMKLSSNEIRFIFHLIEEKYGRGYVDPDSEWEGLKVIQFQGKLSMLLELAARENR